MYKLDGAIDTHRGQPGDGSGLHVYQRGMIRATQPPLLHLIGHNGAGYQPMFAGPRVAEKVLPRPGIDHPGHIVGTAGRYIGAQSPGPAE